MKLHELDQNIPEGLWDNLFRRGGSAERAGGVAGDIERASGNLERLGNWIRGKFGKAEAPPRVEPHMPGSYRPTKDPEEWADMIKRGYDPRTGNKINPADLPPAKPVEVAPAPSPRVDGPRPASAGEPPSAVPQTPPAPKEPGMLSRFMDKPIRNTAKGIAATGAALSGAEVANQAVRQVFNPSPGESIPVSAIHGMARGLSNIGGGALHGVADWGEENIVNPVAKWLGVNQSQSPSTNNGQSQSPSANNGQSQSPSTHGDTQSGDQGQRQRSTPRRSEQEIWTNESFNDLLKLSGVRPITERDKTSGLTKTRKIEMLSESASINVNADNGEELTNILGDIMRLAGVKNVTPDMFPSVEAMPMVKSIEIMGNDLPMDQEHPGAVEIHGSMDAEGAHDLAHELEKKEKSEGDTCEVCQEMIGPSGGCGCEEGMEETYDNTPEPRKQKYDPNNMAHVINKVTTKDLETTPYASASNPMPVKEANTVQDPVKSSLWQAYNEFKSR